ncbi:FtsW/RodA/SpoVE family cell cycle protein, partial [bacterium]|nr:FtsW/RodA/SpoVE family cell cycle protein [bacterium]
FLDPSADPEGASWQVRQAHMQMAAGGWFGTGYGSGTREELGWLPERDNDFVFAVVGRTGGFLAAVGVIALYAWAVLAALGAANTLPTGSARQLCIGLAGYLGAHAALNIAVVLALVPATGFPLVPISAGGSSLIGLGALTGLAVAALRAGAAGYNPANIAPRGTP